MKDFKEHNKKMLSKAPNGSLLFCEQFLEDEGYQIGHEEYFIYSNIRNNGVDMYSLINAVTMTNCVNNDYDGVFEDESDIVEMLQQRGLKINRIVLGVCSTMSDFIDKEKEKTFCEYCGGQIINCDAFKINGVYYHKGCLDKKAVYFNNEGKEEISIAGEL